MKKQKNLFYFILITVIVILSTQISINYFLDPYGVFNKKYINYKYHPNLNYVKTTYISNNKNKYNSFLFGSSRVGTISVEKIKNGRYYNMSISSGLLAEELDILKILLKNKIKIKNVLLGLDEFTFSQFPESHYYDYLRMPYIKLKYKKELIKTYLFIPLYEYRKLIPNSEVKFDINNTGKFLWGNKNLINTNEESSKMEYIRKEKTLEEIKEFIELCEKNKINLTIFFTPQFKIENSKFKKLDEEFEEIKREIENICKYPVYDFTDLGDISRKKEYWYDNSHTKPIVGDMILKKIYKDKVDIDIEVPEYFGQFKNNYELK